MNRKEKSAKFLTWNRKAGGFTLIELVVVIAIMAIIAGVAVPVYNGYINKANQAADEQLLAAVNRAAAAAVLEERGVDMATLSPNALKATVTAPISVIDGRTNDPVAAFTKYFAGNSDASFKYYNSLKFEHGVFVGARSIGAAVLEWLTGTDENGDYLYTWGNKTLVGKKEDIENIGNASYATREGGLTETANTMDAVVGAASKVLNGEKTNIAGFSEFLRENHVNQQDSTAVARALVLYTAQKTAGKNLLSDEEKFAETMTNARNGQFAIDFRDHIADPSDKTAAVIDAAMAYAMVEAFTCTTAGQKASVKLDDGSSMKVTDYVKSVKDNLGNNGDGKAELTAVLNMLNTLNSTDHCPKFISYLNGSTAATDLKGYLSAMNVISQNIDQIDMNTYLAEGMSGDYMSGLVSKLTPSSGS